MKSYTGGKDPSLCWFCRHAIIGGCEWVDSYEPVPGWEATPDSIRPGSHGFPPVPTWQVYKCPKFKCDAPDVIRKEPGQRTYTVSGLKERTYHAKRIEDDEGALTLAAAIIRQACDDWLFYHKIKDDDQRREIERWLRGSYCRSISDINPDRTIRMLKEMAKELEEGEK